MSDHYRVERRTGDNSGCAHCGHDQQWTVVSGQGDEAVEIGTSWGDKELADDVCELMNMAFAAGQEQRTDNSQEEMLVEFFRGEGADMGREGDYRNWSPAETAIHYLRRLPSAEVASQGRYVVNPYETKGVYVVQDSHTLVNLCRCYNPDNAKRIADALNATSLNGGGGA